MPDSPAEPTSATPASILVVDDTEANRDALGRRLERRGYTIAMAEDGATALAMIEKTEFDLVLLDVMMPGMSGLEVLERVRQTKGPTDLPIIMATAKNESTDIVGALKLGANDYVTKPIDFPVALARVQTQLQLRQTVRENRALEQRLSERNAELENANSKLTQYAQRTARELQSAARVQSALLPRSLPDAPGVSFGWQFKPCTELAGDSLNVCRLDDDTLALYVLDVSGHGVAASLLAVAATRMLSEGPESILMRSAIDPAHLPDPQEVVERLDGSFRGSSDLPYFLTMFYATYNIRTRQLVYVSAAHPATIRLTAAGEVNLLESSGLPIGFGEGYSQQAIDLQPGDRLFIYSDGVSESMNDAGDLFGTPRLVETLKSVPVEATLDDHIRRVDADLRAWTGGKPEKDDVTMLAMRVS